jgi:hypothetical protein
MQCNFCQWNRLISGAEDKVATERVRPTGGQDARLPGEDEGLFFIPTRDDKISFECFLETKYTEIVSVV